MLLPLAALAPGRVNLIGEHTDYSGGLAMPAAIQSGVTVTVESVAEEIALRSQLYGKGGAFPADGSGRQADGVGAIRPGRRVRAERARAPAGRRRGDDRVIALVDARAAADVAASVVDRHSGNAAAFVVHAADGARIVAP
jgi:galactokinase